MPDTAVQVRLRLLDRGFLPFLSFLPVLAVHATPETARPAAAAWHVGSLGAWLQRHHPVSTVVLGAVLCLADTCEYVASH